MKMTTTMMTGRYTGKYLCHDRRLCRCHPKLNLSSACYGLLL